MLEKNEDVAASL